MANNKDIEYEMSLFEEELSKLGATNKTVPTAPTKHKISIQMPTSLPSSSSTGFSSIAAMSAVNSYYAQNNQPLPPPLPKVAPPPPPPSIPHNAQKLPAAPKRDLPGTSKVAPTTAAAAATAVAAADMESKAKKAKIDKDKKKKKIIRCAGGQTWEDDTLADWDPDDFRLFCGDLGNEVTDDALARAFQKYSSFQRAKIIRDKRTGKSKGYGFVSFKSSEDFIKAMREMNGKYVGNRPIKLRKSTWKDRNIEIVKKKEQEKQKMGFR
ncbi:unnamed protein product [Brachionus calyciflorus]|uniref:RNA-binding protein 42 n=1 Tax=Brachionus calyciflorus TaxID=104777 RepID=A0A814AF55_9BILA|nr:unnamed protein product [Brachionus calyciflorus]